MERRNLMKEGKRERCLDWSISKRGEAIKASDRSRGVSAGATFSGRREETIDRSRTRAVQDEWGIRGGRARRQLQHHLLDGSWYEFAPSTLVEARLRGLSSRSVKLTPIRVNGGSRKTPSPCFIVRYAL